MPGLNWKKLSGRRQQRNDGGSLPGTAGQRMLGNRKLSIGPMLRSKTPTKCVSVSGEWALKECEEHTTWVNNVLQRKPGAQISDLRKSLGSGVTLVSLSESLTSCRVSGVTYFATTRDQTIINIQKCLYHLKEHGVNVSDVTAADIVDGNLKSCLSLLISIRLTFDPNYRKQQFDEDIGDEQRCTPINNAPVMRSLSQVRNTPPLAANGVAYRHPTPTSAYSSSLELLPGAMAKEEVPIRHSAHEPIVSRTQLDRNGVSQIGVQERRQQLYRGNTGSLSPVRQQNAKVTSSKPVPAPRVRPSMSLPGTNNPHAPVTKSRSVNEQTTHAWPPNQPQNGAVVTGSGLTVQERIKSILQDGAPAYVPGSMQPHQDRTLRHGSATAQQPGTIRHAETFPHVPAGHMFPVVQRSAADDAQGFVNGGFQTDHSSSQQMQAKPKLGHSGSLEDSALKTSAPSGDELRAAWSRMYGQVPGQKQVYHHPTPNYTPQNSAFINRDGLKLSLQTPQTSRPVSQGHGHRYYPTDRPQTAPSSRTLHNALGYTDLHDQRPPAMPSGYQYQSNQSMVSASAGQQNNVDMVSAFHNTQLSPSSRYTRYNNTHIMRQTDSHSVDSQGYTVPSVISRGTDDSKIQQLKNMSGIAPPVVPPINIQKSNFQPNFAVSTVTSNVSGSYDDLRIRSPLGSVNDLNSDIRQDGKPFLSHFSTMHQNTPDLLHSAEKINSLHEDLGFNPNDSIFDHNITSECSSRSVTPPLPPLSPSVSSTESPFGYSPSTSPRLPRSLSATMLSTPKTHTSPKNSPRIKSAPVRRDVSNLRRVSSEQITRDTKHDTALQAPRNVYTQARQPKTRGGALSDVKESDTDSVLFDVDNTTLTVDNSPRSSSGVTTEPVASNRLSLNHRPFSAPSNKSEMENLQQKMAGLEAMYSEVLHVIGVDRDFLLRERRHSIGSSDTSSMQRERRYKAPRATDRLRKENTFRVRESRTTNKRFQRLESHVVTLARSVAHLSSEMHTQSALVQEVSGLKQEMMELREVALCNHRSVHQAFITPDATTTATPAIRDRDRIHTWLPGLINPRRVNKLTKFFGQEPPLLDIFLQNLGYEQFIANFAKEHIGMIELPYMTEERLRSIGLPMGPRLRILHEAKVCFEQDKHECYH